MKNILLFAGTTEGRLLADFLIHQPVRLHTAVATVYGASLLPSAPSMTVSSHRMNEAQMIDFIQQQHFDLVLDATHPYASEASANISGACTRTQVPYLRILRDCQTSADTSSNPIHPSEIFVDTTAEKNIQLKQLCKNIPLLLNKRELLIITLRYGLNGQKEMTQREIAKKLNISRSYVSRIEKKALLKLKTDIV